MRSLSRLPITLVAALLWAGPVHAQTHQVEVVITEAGVGTPVEGARVQAKGGGLGALTDAGGRAILRGFTGDEVEVEVSRIGLEAVAVVLTPPRLFPLRVALGIQAVELDRVEAEGTARRSEIDVTQPYRREVIRGEELARAEVRGARIEDLLQTVPGVRVVCPAGGSCQVRLVRAHMSLH